MVTVIYDKEKKVFKDKDKRTAIKEAYLNVAAAMPTCIVECNSHGEIIVHKEGDFTQEDKDKIKSECDKVA